MKVSTRFGNEPATTNLKEKIIQSNSIPASLREIHVEYELKDRFSKLFPDIDINDISEAIDNVCLSRFIEPLREDPSNDSIKALLAKAICFELKCLGAQPEFYRALDCIKNA